MDTTTFAYIAGFLDGDGSIFFQIVKTKSKKQPFKIRSSVAFYQKTCNAEILRMLQKFFGVGYIRQRKTGISDYTVVVPSEVKKILLSLLPYVKLKKKQVDVGLEILARLEQQNSREEFLEICRLVDKFGEMNYSRKRTITAEVVENHFKNNNFTPVETEAKAESVPEKEC
ncbi:LAGLIDADG family homing endonuclease [Candidatus Woesearchaeota archaeon]|nr:LAGLIDADG family homing endonuclease [Candidatus Woesearchaeota archaeon]